MRPDGDPYYSKSAHNTLEATPLPGGPLSPSNCGLSEPRPTLRPCQQALGLRAALRQTVPAILCFRNRAPTRCSQRPECFCSILTLGTLDCTRLTMYIEGHQATPSGRLPDHGAKSGLPAGPPPSLSIWHSSKASITTSSHPFWLIWSSSSPMFRILGVLRQSSLAQPFCHSGT
jgi:hypothetical protein